MPYPKSNMNTRTTAAAAVLAILVSSAFRVMAQTRPDVTSDLYYLSLNECLHTRAEQYKSLQTPLPASATVISAPGKNSSTSDEH